MRTLQTPKAESSGDLFSRRRSGHSAYGLFAHLLRFAPLFVAQLFFAGQTAAAQVSPAAKGASTHAHKAVHAQKNTAPATPPAAQPAPAPAPAPVQPKLPDWPANDLPAEASVVFDSRGLLIVASNSSLAQVLKQVSTVTGAKVEGMDIDQRVFGTFGPGPARDVLTQLLDGSGYNLLLIGDRGEGTPRRIVLSIRTGSGLHPSGSPTPSQPSPPSPEDSDSDQEADEPDQPQPPPSGAAPGVPARSEQQFLLERQQQLQRMQSTQQPPQN